MGMGVGGGDDGGGGRDAVPPAALGEDEEYEKSARRVSDASSREEEEEDSLSARRERRAARWALPESVRGDPPTARARDGDEADGDEAVSAGREAEVVRTLPLVIGAVNHSVLVLERAHLYAQSIPLRCALCVSELAFSMERRCGFWLALTDEDESR